jgi:hypothetical protein
MRDATTQLCYDLLGCSLLQIQRSYWAVKLASGEWICEARVHTDLRTASERPFDWSNDLVANGEVKRIKELWLLCPPNATSPLGNTAMLPITEPGTAFQFKVAHAMSNFAESWRQADSHLIGRVTDKFTGDCECFIWDAQYACLIAPPWQTNVYQFGTWKESLAPRGELALATLGVDLS